MKYFKIYYCNDILIPELLELGLKTFNAYCGGRQALQTAVMKASRGASKERALQNPTFLLIAFNKCSVVASSVLEKLKINT